MSASGSGASKVLEAKTQLGFCRLVATNRRLILISYVFPVHAYG